MTENIDLYDIRKLLYDTKRPGLVAEYFPVVVLSYRPSSSFQTKCFDFQNSLQTPSPKIVSNLKSIRCIRINNYYKNIKTVFKTKSLDGS